MKLFLFNKGLNSKIALYSILILSPFLSLGQEIQDVFRNKAISLKKEFKDEDIAQLFNKSSYSFEYNSARKTVEAIEEESINFISLGHSVKGVKALFYNQNSEISSYEIKNEKGKKIVHEKYCGHVSSGDIFYSDAQLCGYSFPLSKIGSQAFFKSKKVFLDPKYLTKVIFHERQAVEEREIIFDIPEWIKIDLIEFNFEGYDIEKSETEHVNNGKKYTRYVYKTGKLKPLPQEDNTPGILHFLPHILVVIKEYQQDDESVTLLNSMDDLYIWYNSLVKSLIYEKNGMQEIANEIIKDLDSDEDKIRALYYWVQDNIRYIAFEDGIAAFRPEESKEVYFNRYGDCKGMANLLKNLLLDAGFDARLTWIGTRQLPYPTSIPSLAIHNHMITTVFNDGKRYILDPTEKFGDFNEPAERIQGRDILIENGSDYIIDKVPLLDLDENDEENKINFTILDNELKGKGTLTIRGEKKKQFMYALDILDGKSKHIYMRSMVSGNSLPDKFNVTNEVTIEKENPIYVDYDCNLSNKISSFGNEIYLNMDIEEDFSDMEVEKNRMPPLDFHFRVNKKIVSILEIPDNYDLSYIPKPFLKESPFYRFNFYYVIEGRTLKYIKEYKLNTSMLPVNQFEEWNTTVKSLKEYYSDQIILKSNN
ncbi:MAG: transglutaminase-like domain-containing protein [Cyclobacteriaceae bacterium]|nr:transglutaminase-like domain-containing protein [Cyclobacteriaceae bacterium]